MEIKQKKAPKVKCNMFSKLEEVKVRILRSYNKAQEAMWWDCLQQDGNVTQRQSACLACVRLLGHFPATPHLTHNTLNINDKYDHSGNRKLKPL